MTPDEASLVMQEKLAKQRYDRAMAALRAQAAGEVATHGDAVKAELDEAKRGWESVRKRLELFQADRSSGT